MAHTPGPWKAKLGRTPAFDCSIVTEEGFIVARTSESNGPLIATAPDLLSVLQRLTDRLGYSHDMWPEVKEAIAAIAKAEGH